MLLSDNTKRVIDLIEMFDDLKDIDKIILTIQYFKIQDLYLTMILLILLQY